MIASRYEIVAQLGAGGMGTVFKARDRTLEETVAIKTVRGAARDTEMTTRFRSEIKLAWKVRHRNVCGIHEYGEDGDLLYISMELVDGRDLKQIVRDQGPMSCEQAFGIAIQVGEGLQAIHDVGVIHRDLKSANIMLDPDGVVRLMDFGIAKIWGEAGGESITMTGQVVGSPEYMSPEQVRGRKIDFRSDLYAFGVVLFELFTGRVPFRADTPVATMLMHLEQPPPLEGPEAATLPAVLLAVVRKALAKNPEARYGSCREMVAALREAHAAFETRGLAVVPSAPAAPVGDDEGPTLLVTPTLGRAQARLLIPPLLRALKHADKSVRAGAAQALGRVGPDARVAIPELSEALGDEAWEVRADAARALGAVGPEGDAAVALETALGDADTRVRAAAAEALAGLRPPPPAVTAAPKPAPAAPTPSFSVAAPSPDAPAPAAIDPPLARPAVAAASPEAARANAPQANPPRAARAPAREPLPRLPSVSHVEARPRRISIAGLALGAGAIAVALMVWTLAPWASREPSPASPVPLGVSMSPPEPASEPTPAAAPVTAPSSPPPTTPRRVAMAPAAVPSAAPSSAVAKPPASVPPTTLAVPPATLAAVVLPTTLAAAPGPTPAPPAPGSPRAPLALQAGEPGVVAPVCERCPAPDYPPVAERRRAEGTVELRVLVDPKGNVVRTETVQGVDLLTSAALKSVAKWRYRPGFKDGTPVAVWLPVSVRFQLPR